MMVIGLLAALWAWFFWHLHLYWQLDPHYSYGWATPMMGLFSFYLRGGLRQVNPASGAQTGRFPAFALGALLFLLWPLHLLEESSPDWRALSWALGCVLLGLSWLVLQRAGLLRDGRGLWVPFLFFLGAVPWPARLETEIVQALTSAVSVASVGLVRLSGVHAARVGNVISLPTGNVGVTEACSGIRGVQMSIVVSLFLGELLFLTFRRRLLFVVAGIAWILLCNLGRATVLILIAADAGTDALALWHDRVGLVFSAAGLGGLITYAYFSSEPALPADWTRPVWRSVPSRFTPQWITGLAGLAWLLLVFGSVEAYYRRHEAQLTYRTPWTVRWPEQATAFAEARIAPEVRAVLHYDEASSARWRTEPLDWWGFYGRWAPGRVSRQLVSTHSPEICLPTVGLDYVGTESPYEYVPENRPDVSLRFNAARFRLQENTVFVFTILEADRYAAESRDGIDWTARGRIRQALAGERNQGQRLLEVIVSAPSDTLNYQEATAQAGKQLAQIIAF